MAKQYRKKKRSKKEIIKASITEEFEITVGGAKRNYFDKRREENPRAFH